MVAKFKLRLDGGKYNTIALSLYPLPGLSGGITMLLLTRKVGQKIRIGDDMTVTVAKVRGDFVTIWVKSKAVARTRSTRLGHCFMIGGTIKVTVVQLRTYTIGSDLVHVVKLGFDAPAGIKIYREEIWQRIQADRQKLAREAPVTLPPGVALDAPPKHLSCK